MEKSGKGVSHGISVNGLDVWCRKQLLKTELLSRTFRPVDHLFTKNVLVTCLMASHCLIKYKKIDVCIILLIICTGLEKSRNCVQCGV